IAWVGGELRLDADGRSERIDYSAQLDKASYQGWFAGLFATFVTAMDSRAADPYLQDIQRVAAVLEVAYQAAERGVRLPIPDGGWAAGCSCCCSSAGRASSRISSRASVWVGWSRTRSGPAGCSCRSSPSTGLCTSATRGRGG